MQQSFPFTRYPENMLLREIFTLLTGVCVCNNTAYAPMSRLLRRHDEFLFRQHDDTATTSTVQLLEQRH